MVDKNIKNKGSGVKPAPSEKEPIHDLPIEEEIPEDLTEVGPEEGEIDTILEEEFLPELEKEVKPEPKKVEKTHRTVMFLENCATVTREGTLQYSRGQLAELSNEVLKHFQGLYKEVK